MKTIRVYKAKFMVVEANELHYQKIESMLNFIDGEIGIPIIKSHTYPIRQWGQMIDGKMTKTSVCLADDLLQEIFNDQERNLRDERESLSKAYKVVSKYHNANLWQRLKYLFLRKIN